MEPKFTIGGREYEVPRLSTYDMDEWQILYDKTGLTLDTVEDSPLSPGLLRSMLIVAYRRGNPDAAMKQIEAIVGAMNFGDVVGMILGDEDDAEADDGPPVAAASPPPPSETSSHGSSDPGSGSGSGQLAVVPPPTGTPLSATLHTSNQAASGS